MSDNTRIGRYDVVKFAQLARKAGDKYNKTWLTLFARKLSPGSIAARACAKTL